MNYVLADYIESGTFQGGEEDVSEAGIKRGEEIVILKKADFDMFMDKFSYDSVPPKR